MILSNLSNGWVVWNARYFPLDVDPPWMVPVYGFPWKSLLPASKTETQAYFLAAVMAAAWPSCSGPYTYIPSLVALL